MSAWQYILSQTRLANKPPPYIEQITFKIISTIFCQGSKLNKFLDLHLSIANGFVSPKIYDKRDDFDFDIVNFPFFGW